MANKTDHFPVLRQLQCQDYDRGTLDADQFATLQAIEYCSIVVPIPELGAVRYFGIWCAPYISLNADGVAALTERGANKLKHHKEIMTQKKETASERLEELNSKCDEALTAIMHAMGQLAQKGGPSRQQILDDLSIAMKHLNE